jgi:hypothetical protein
VPQYPDASSSAVLTVALPPTCTVYLARTYTGSRLAAGESVVKYNFPLNVLKGTYDHSCCLARSYEYNHLRTDSPMATPAPR